MSRGRKPSAAKIDLLKVKAGYVIEVGELQGVPIRFSTDGLFRISLKGDYDQADERTNEVRFESDSLAGLEDQVAKLSKRREPLNLAVVFRVERCTGYTHSNIEVDYDKIEAGRWLGPVILLGFDGRNEQVRYLDPRSDEPHLVHTTHAYGIYPADSPGIALRRAEDRKAWDAEQNRKGHEEKAGEIEEQYAAERERGSGSETLVIRENALRESLLKLGAKKVVPPTKPMKITPKPAASKPVKRKR